MDSKEEEKIIDPSDVALNVTACKTDSNFLLVTICVCEICLTRRSLIRIQYLDLLLVFAEPVSIILYFEYEVG